MPAAIPSTRGIARTPPRALHALRIIHPFPTLLNVAATLGLAVVAAGGLPDLILLLRLLAVMFLAQSCIGATNDLCDRELDARSKPYKPLVAGTITPLGATIVACVCGVGALIIASTISAPSLALAALGLACGLAYDVALKRSALSALPFMIAIPTLPLWVWVSLDVWESVLYWLIPLGALLGLSLHLVNTLPDIASDEAAGVRGLAHRLGERTATVIAWGSFALALLLAVAIAPVVGYDWRIFGPTLLFGCTCLAAGVGAQLRHTATSMQASFSVLGIGCAGLAVGWLAAAT